MDSCATCLGIAARSLSVKRVDRRNRSPLGMWKRRGFEGEMLIVPLSLLVLSLTQSTTWAALPSFLENLDQDSAYHKCDSAMCWWTTFDIEVDRDFRLDRNIDIYRSKIKSQ